MIIPKASGDYKIMSTFVRHRAQFYRKTVRGTPNERGIFHEIT